MGRAFVDLSHVVYDGLITYKGFPAPIICDFLSREASRKFYRDGTSFQIGRIDMIANTGTYIDTPFHRFEDGKDLAEVELSSLAGIGWGWWCGRPGWRAARSIAMFFSGLDVRGQGGVGGDGLVAALKATDAYFEGHVFMTRGAAEYLRDEGAALVGLDSYNIDDTEDGERPVRIRFCWAWGFRLWSICAIWRCCH